MWFFLSSLLPSYYRLREKYTLRGPRIKYGFNARTEFKYVDELSEIKGVRPGHFTGNEVTLFGVYNGELTLDVPIHDGLNKDLVDTKGRIDVMLVTDKVGKYVIEKKKVPEFMASLSDAQNLLNSVSLFYNLLRLYYIYVHSDVTYKPSDNYYDNGHVKIVNTQLFTEFLTATKMVDGAAFDKAMVSIDKKPLDVGDMSQPAYAWQGRITHGQMDVIAMAAGSWRQQAPFALCHNSPELAEALIINPTGSDTPVEASAVNAKIIADVINNLVTSNRLYTDFAYAYLMVTQIFVSPVPRSAEAAAWVLGTQTVNMPHLKAIAGYVPFLTEGVPFARRADWTDTYKEWVKEASAVLFHSIAVVEACYIELANVIKLRHTDEINSANFVQTSVDGTPVTYGGVIQDVSLVATRYGTSVDLPYALSCGLNRARGLITTTELKVPVTITDAEAHNYYALEISPAVVEMTNFVVVTQLTAAMYPVITYGVNEDVYYANGLRDTVTATAIETDAGDIVFSNVVDFTKFMNIMRMMGYDVTATEAISQRRVTNWADNASGRFIYTDINLSESAQVFIINRDNIMKRPNSWIDIGQKRGSVTLTYSMTNLRMKMFCGGSELQLAGTLVTTARNIRDLKTLVQDAGGTEGVRFVPLKKMRESDFRLVRYSIAPMVRAQPILPLPETQVESGDNVADEETPGGNLSLADI